jgi:hypothetical protein
MALCPAATKIKSPAAGGNMKEEELTLLVNKDNKSQLRKIW